MIEFALAAPFLFLILIGIIELGLIFVTSSVLESATGVGSRLGRTGYVPFGSREIYIRDQIVRVSGGYLDPQAISVRMLAYNNFDVIGQPEPCSDPPACANFVDINGNGRWDSDQGAVGAGGGGQVVLYRVTYLWRLFTPLVAQFMQNAVPLTAIAVVRNEQFE